MMKNHPFSINPRKNVQSIVDSVLRKNDYMQPSASPDVAQTQLPVESKLASMKDYLNKRGAVT